MTNRSRKQFDTVKSTCYSQLEARHLLSADFGVELFDATEVSSPQPEVEFVDVQWKGQTLEAKNDEWLIWQEEGEGVQSQDFDSLKVGDANVLTVNGTEYVWAEEQKLQVTREITSGLFVLSGADNFSYERVAESVAAWMPNAVVEPNFKLTVAATPDDTDFGQLWGLNNTGQLGGVVDADIDAVEAWDVTTGSSEVVVGVIDTGIDYTHPDLANNIWTNPGEIADNGIDDDNNGYIDDIHGWDFANNDNDPFDDDGHGTHVAGTIGAVGNNSLGVVGVSHDVSLVALKFLGGDGSGTTAGAIEAVAYSNTLRESGVNLVMTNNSWGGGGFSSPLEAVIQDALSLDILFVAAAGNDGSSFASYPAAYDVDNVISVAATDRFDQLASFSNFGATIVDLAAPGVDILSTQPNNSYATFSGTSMASPHVAGALALLVANEPNLTALELKERLLERVDVLPQLDGIVATSGRLNVNELLDQVSGVDFTADSFLTPGTVSLELDDPTGFAADASVTITSSSGDTETLAITATGSLEFATSIESVAGAASSNDGILQLTSGDTLTATYFDPDDELGVTHTDTALVFEDDYGNDAASATSLGADLSVSGNIDVSDDEDWFSFSALLGMEYEFQTTLGSLNRSEVNLYGTDGTTLLATGNGLVSFVAPSNGTYFVSVGHSGNSFGTYDLAGTVSIPESTVDFDAATFPVPGLVGLQLTDPTGFSAGAVVTIETSSGDVEDLVITETGSLVASASIDAVQGAASTNDGILQITSGDTLTATFFDDDDGFGGTFTATDTATAIGDDHGSDAGTATDVNSPIDVAGDLERAADADWFRFNAVPGFQYEFETTLGTLGDSFLYLYDTDGTTLLTSNDDGGAGLASLITYQFSEGGSYYLEVRAFSTTQLGTYQLTGTAPEVASVSFDAGAFLTPGPVGLTVTDVNGFAPGATVAITTTSGDWELISIPATGSFSFATAVESVLGASNPNDGILQVSADAVLTATYVDSDDGSGGTFTATDTATVSVDDHGNDAASASAVNLPLNVSGNINVSEDEDWFSFNALPGLEYEFQVTPGTLGQSVLSLYDTDGTTLLATDSGFGFGSLVSFVAPDNGTYFVSVGSSGNSFGTYDLSGTFSIAESTVDFNAATFPVPGLVGLQLTDPTGFLTGAIVTIETSSGDVEDLVITETGSLVASASINAVQGAANVNDGVLQVASGDTLTATYFDGDNGFGGTFTATDTAAIISDDHGNDAATATVVGSPFDVSGDLEGIGDADWFRFDAVPGFLYEFETTLGSLSDSYLYLYDTNGTTLLTSNDDGGAGLASRITYQFAQSGSYYLEVRAYIDRSAGTYQLTGTGPATTVVVVEDVIASGTGFSSAFIDAVDGGGVDAGNGLGYSLVGDHQLETLPWMSIDTIYLQFSDDVSASIAAGDIVLTGTDGGVYNTEMISYNTGSNTAEFRVSDVMAIDSLVISIMDGTVSNASGSLLDGEWASGQTDSSGDGNAGGQFDFFFNLLAGDQDGSGQVNTGDAYSVFASNTDVATEFNYRRDIDGSGQISTADAFAAFAHNTYGLPAAPIAPLAPAAIATLTVDDASELAASVTDGSLSANDAFFAKERSLNVEDFEVSQTIVDGLASVLKADYLS